jgi:hypothetical protein
MAKNTVGAIISAAITLILFVGIPYMLPEYLPTDIMQSVVDSGFDLSGFLNQIMLIGAVTAGLTLAKGLVDESSVIALLVSITQNVSTIAFTVIFLGAGNVASLGVTELTVNVPPITSVIKMDLRIFIYFTFLTVALRVIKSYLEWNEARIEAAPPGRITA